MSPSNMASGDDFINILFAPEDDGSNPISEAQKKDKSFYNQWVDKCMLLQSIYLFYAISTLIAASARHSGPPISW
jgi:hypothetical protein